MVKQVIVYRKDLHTRAGKTAAQVAHASLKVFLDRMYYVANRNTKDQQTFDTGFTPAMMEWTQWEEGKPGFTKIVVGCDSEEELYIIEAKAKAADLPYALIVDNGVTEFHGVHTPTCICIGPAEAELIDPITSNYSLL
jgi:PTH2 family peptidyl-tRNA hydrolase